MDTYNENVSKETPSLAARFFYCTDLRSTVLWSHVVYNFQQQLNKFSQQWEKHELGYILLTLTRN